MEPIRRVIVLGGGSAGLLAAITLKRHAAALNVTVVRSKEIGVIGVGEGSTVGFPRYLHTYLAIEPAEFYRLAQPTWKLGLRFIRWGPRERFHYSFAIAYTLQWQMLRKPPGYYCDEEADYANLHMALMSEDRVFLRGPQGLPRVTHDFSYHIENRHFVDFLEGHAARLGIVLIDDTVEHVRQNEHGVSSLRLASGREVAADLYVDSSGFASVLLGRTLDEPYLSFRSTLFCDRAVVGGWERTDEVIKPYTSVETMDAGWCWQIDHEHRINRGYVYASSFISDDEAEREFRAKNPQVGPTRVVHFKSGRHERGWVKNVVAIGNSCGFVEPLEATSLGAIGTEAALLVETLIDSDFAPGESQIKHFNRAMAMSWDNIRRFLAIHYRFNTRLDTPFWRACRADTDLAGAEEIVEFYQENGPSHHGRVMLLNQLDQFTIDGWLALLVGMRVPHRRKFAPSDAERSEWRRIGEHFKQQAQGAMTVKEALQAIRSARWRWSPDFYKPMPPLLEFRL
ncbi:MAG: tryptophan halogenase family protein [Pirellulales bacterium]